MTATTSQTTTTTTDEGLRCERLLAAPVETVWDACTRPELMARWMCPNPALATTAESDLRVGGQWRVRMGEEHTVAGEYVEIAAPSRLAFTWAWETMDRAPVDWGTSTVVIELVAVEEGTRFVLTHTGLRGADDVRGHAHGWEGCLVRLPAVL